MTSRPELIALIHVPKTAGSTLNAALQAAYGDGVDHIESKLSTNACSSDALEKAPWISGHLTLDGFKNHIEPVIDRKVRYIACMREPFAQVASHYNWLIEIGRRSPNFFDAHPPEIKEMHKTIASSDTTDAYSIIANLHRYGDMFLNCQSRYVLGASYRAPEAHLRGLLEPYETVITEQSISNYIDAILAGKAGEIARENTSPYHFDRAVFEDPRVVEFLHEKNAEDIKLYRHVVNAGTDARSTHA